MEFQLSYSKSWKMTLWNSSRWFKIPAYIASSTNNSKFVDKLQDKEKQFQASRGGDKRLVSKVCYVDSSGTLLQADRV